MYKALGSILSSGEVWGVGGGRDFPGEHSKISVLGAGVCGTQLHWWSVCLAHPGPCFGPLTADKASHDGAHCDPSTFKVKMGRSEVQGHSKYEDSLRELCESLHTSTHTLPGAWFPLVMHAHSPNTKETMAGGQEVKIVLPTSKVHSQPGDMGA